MDDVAKPATHGAAIVGKRSWIAQALTEQLKRDAVESCVIEKDDLFGHDRSQYNCIYLILGRAHPHPKDELSEQSQLVQLLANRPQHMPRKMVYISSQNLTPHKLKCEELISESRYAGITKIIRPPAVFGPNQHHMSRMLVPSLARKGAELHLMSPHQMTQFISVNDLASYMAKFSFPDWTDLYNCGSPNSSGVIPGTFWMTPHQMRELYIAFKGIEYQESSFAQSSGW